MRSTPSISVILAAHNQGQYLPQTLASLRIQTVGMNALQFIFIDDASTDETGAILKSFCHEMPHARVEHVSFHSIAQSRNHAIGLVQAPYIIYVDGDDILVPDACEQWLKAAERHQSDIVLAPLRHFKGNVTEAPAGDVVAKEHSVKETWHMLLKHRDYMGHLIGSLFASRLFASLRFPHLICYSDVYIVPDLLKQNPRVVWLDRPLYNYRKHTMNISGNLTDEKAQGMLKVFDKLRAQVMDKTELRLFESLCVRQCRIMLDNTKGLGAETRKEIKKWIDATPLWPFLLSPRIRLSRKRVFLQTRNEVKCWE
jgi:glycosyltransferase involved in cell wall biosynthesis